MNHFQRRGAELYAEGVSLVALAEAVGTPTYVYSSATLRRHYRVVREALPGPDPLVCFSVKACPNVAVLALLAKLGAGADIVSGGELRRALTAGIPPDRVVFSGVGKLEWEIAAALEAGIYTINAESLSEIETIGHVARRLGRPAPISLRINPGVDPRTHPHIATGLRETKFGLGVEEALQAYERMRDDPALRVTGIACHIGSQLTDLEPLSQALCQMIELVGRLAERGIDLAFLDMGGGLGIPYDERVPPHPTEYGRMLQEQLEGRSLRVVVEPGRVIAGNAGLLLTRVIRKKLAAGRMFAIVDAGMNDLLRPALYGSFHGVEPVVDSGSPDPPEPVDVVGPICESADQFAAQRALPPFEAGDLLAIRSAGAYGFSMASNYNSRPRPAEVLVDGDRYAVVRERERLEDLMRGERIPEWL